MSVGKSIPRVDAYEKVTGRARYTDDCLDREAPVAKVVHTTIANGLVKRVDTADASRVPGVVRIVTCLDVPDIQFPTAGHPWSTEAAHQDIDDRRLLNQRVRYYGDDVAAVVAEDEIAAARAARLIRVEYEQYPPVFTVQQALAEGASTLHQERPGNLIARSQYALGDYEAAAATPGAIHTAGDYHCAAVQHCHIENPVSYAYMERGRVVVVASTQIPHIMRRVIAQALGLRWGMVRVIKPYIGGGFGNKQDILYEPLNAYLTTLVGGRAVKLELSREETSACTRTRHHIDFHIESYVRPNGRLLARGMKSLTNSGAYASHGHAIGARGLPHLPGDFLLSHDPQPGRLRAADDVWREARASSATSNRPLSMRARYSAAFAPPASSCPRCPSWHAASA